MSLFSGMKSVLTVLECDAIHDSILKSNTVERTVRRYLQLKSVLNLLTIITIILLNHSSINSNKTAYFFYETIAINKH